ncbi:MAG: methyltransferase domain-containing protein [Microcoleaceae cyanobacterium]
METIKLNLGCGDRAITDWINVDYFIGARLSTIPGFSWLNKKIKLFDLEWDRNILIHDLTTIFPWKNETVDIIYSSHTLEHLNKEQGELFLSECYRVLKKNGIIRIVVPDLKSFVEHYLTGDILAENFVKNLYVLYEEPGDTFLKKKLAPLLRYPHKCMYDTPSLIRIMSNLGFTSCSKQPFESDILNIEKIELQERTKEAVIVEARK